MTPQSHMTAPHMTTQRLVRTAALVCALAAGAIADASAQQPQLVFTMPAPEPRSSTGVQTASAVVEERSLAVWAGTASDFGVGETLSSSRWTLRSITSMTALPIDGRNRPRFQQVDGVRSLFSSGSTTVAGGGGIRQEWDGTRVLIGRVVAGSDLGG